MSALEYRNNWASDEYYVEGKRIKNLEAVRIDDGPEMPVIGREVSVPYYDMGHTYSAQSLHYFVVIEQFGLRSEIDLNTLVRDRKVVAVKFDLA